MRQLIVNYGLFSNRIEKHILAILASVSMLSACGGGGGGGGADNSTGLRILHGSMDAAPIDVSTSTSPDVILQRGSFASINDYAGISEGAQVLHVTRAKTPTVGLGNFNIDVKSSQRFSVLFYGDNAIFGLHTRILDDSIPENLRNETLLRVVDGMTGAAEVSISVGDSSGSGPIGLAAAFGSASTYSPVAAGPAHIVARRTSDGKVLTSISVSLLVGKAYTFFVAGEVDYYVRGLLLSDR